MAVTDNFTNRGSNAKVIKDSALSNTVVPNILAATGTIKILRIVNGDSSNINFFKAFDNTKPTSGTTEPDIIIPVATSATQFVYAVNGFTFSNGASIIGSRTAGVANTAAATSFSADIVSG
ncbi:MAG TPA: hypothetical protein DCW74_16445 [Alteromonas australica]|uniref:Uncharacterized protein n=1 Tax=Alteromonas australica TaxID=589873 RepID=A0A350P7P5_9ALTE|nr:hypothetical protein [Alteromonas australica]